MISLAQASFLDRIDPHVVVADRGADVVVLNTFTGRVCILRGLLAELLAALLAARDSGADEVIGDEEALETLADQLRRARVLVGARGDQVRLKHPYTRVVLTGSRGAELKARIADRGPTVEVAPDLPSAELSERDLVVSLSGVHERSAQQRENLASISRGAAYLSARVGAGGTTLGPFVLPGISPCLECLWWRNSPNWGSARKEVAADVLGVNESGWTSVFAAPSADAWDHAVLLAALEVQRIASGQVPNTLANVLAADPSHARYELHPLVEVPHCRTCRLAPSPAAAGSAGDGS
ncbi:TOMM precursor leader peptide-binding protein [Streptomyces monashensis]|uniref:THIF-type NAD/FAD binding fold domain-containing protein n=1 Tax=Streptomyces monashensis TaxID=1678012 RepID=A0A1S2PIN3_9ACTN|nr:TOMM precursor leader peptide-binding protein [Streptomyces monashensis]OIJ93607.1 hypothetical protein BIV23_37280 [Streptomyces monashensis]